MLIPLFFLSSCLAQPNPQLDSLQKQISALRVDIEELHETREDIKRLGADIDRLSGKLENTSINPIQRLDDTSRLLVGNMASTKAQMQELADEVSIIKENFNEYTQVIQNISDQTKTLESNLVKQILKLQVKIEEITPEKLYQTAQDFFMNKHYHEALKTFNSFLKQYPKHSLKENAWLFKGEALFHMGEFEKAIAELNSFVSQNPKSSLIPAAIYIKAESLLSLERKSEAREEFQRLVTDYPFSQEAIRAKSRLDSLQ